MSSGLEQCLQFINLIDLYIGLLSTKKHIWPILTKLSALSSLVIAGKFSHPNFEGLHGGPQIFQKDVTLF